MRKRRNIFDGLESAFRKLSKIRPGDEKYFIRGTSKNDWWLYVLEILGLIIFVCILIYFLKKAPKSDYEFQGLADEDIDKVKNTPVTGRKKRSPKRWKREEMCREILQKIYGVPFPSKRPRFLKSPATGQNLELDCYNEKLKIALEHDGIQHSQYNKFFHRKGPQEFLYQVVKDDYKNKRCREEGVCLIRVPHWVPETELEKFIQNKLRAAGKL